MDYDYKILEEKYKKLPEDIQLAMASTDVSKKILEIAEKHDLFLDQADKLSDDISYVMLGLLKSGNFIRQITKDLEIDEKKAIEITQDLNKEVFDDLRVSLKKIEDENGKDTEGYSNESGSLANGKIVEGQVGEENAMTDEEKAQKNSVISAVEKAGGFVIEKQEDAPLKAEEMVNTAVKENLVARKNPVNVLEKETPKSGVTQDSRFHPSTSLGTRGSNNTESSLQPDHLLGDTPELKSAPQAPLEQTSSGQNVPKQPREASIVDTLLSHGVAMSMDTTPAKPVQKVKPYDGTDPYREPAE